MEAFEFARLNLTFFLGVLAVLSKNTGWWRTGEGSRGLRTMDWEGKKIRLETIVSEEVALRILSRLQEAYFPYYAVVAFVENVEVVRGEKYI
ncbi:MAG: P-II family nitrogen regulator [Thermaceae bacterium]